MSMFILVFGFFFFFETLYPSKQKWSTVFVLPNERHASVSFTLFSNTVRIRNVFHFILFKYTHLKLKDFNMAVAIQRVLFTDSSPFDENEVCVTLNLNSPFFRWHHLTRTSRIQFVFPFLFKFFNPSGVSLTSALFTRHCEAKTR